MASVAVGGLGALDSAERPTSPAALMAGDLEPEDDRQSMQE